MHPSDENASAQIEMPRYQSHKKVWALQIDMVAGTHLTFAEKGYAPIDVDPKMFIRYTPVRGDYYVVYDDGYKSISPRLVFEEGYSRIIRNANTTMKEAAAEIARLTAERDVARANHKDVVETKRRTDERLRAALDALQKIYDISGQGFESATHERQRGDDEQTAQTEK